MFEPGSRYISAPTYTVNLPEGREIRAVVPPLPRRFRIEGEHPRQESERLDHIAGAYLNNPTQFWALCDAANAMSPDALSTRDRIPIPRREA